MRFLLLDRNDLVTKAMASILKAEGHEVSIERHIDDGVAMVPVFKPDIVVLDNGIDGEEGFQFIVRAHQAQPDASFRVILTKDPGDSSPADTSKVVADLDKPFGTEEFLEAVDKAINAVSSVPAPTKRRISLPQGFKKPEPVKPLPGPPILANDARFGQSYVFFEVEPSDVYSFVESFDPKEYQVMIVTSMKMKAMKERFFVMKPEVITLSGGRKAGALDIAELGTAMVRINEFIDASPMPVVVFDNFREISEVNGLNRAVVLLHQIIDNPKKRKTVAVSVDGSSLSAKDRSILLNMMRDAKTIRMVSENAD